MAQSRKSRRKKIKHHRVNLATVFFCFVFIYLVSVVWRGFDKTTVASYEVTEHSIENTISTYGIALREESVYKTDAAGYVTYYGGDGQRIAKNSTVYTLDQTGEVKNLVEEAEESEVSYSQENYQDIRDVISGFKHNFNENTFSSVYDFQYDLENILLEANNSSLIKKIDELIKKNSNSNSVSKVRAPSSGIISYSYDGMEGIKLEDLKSSMFDTSNHTMKQIRSYDQYEKGTPVYRLSTSYQWKIAILINNEQYLKLKDKKRLRLKFKKDNITISVPMDIRTIHGDNYIIVSLNKYMSRYVDQRYIDCSIIIDSEEGLKVPNSCILKKKLYKIPKDYTFYKTEASTTPYILKAVYGESGKIEKHEEFYPVVYAQDKKYIYVSPSEVKKGTVLIGKSTDDTYAVNAGKKYKGVYSMNKGYAQFRIINIKYTADDYSIVEEGNTDSIALYDHIVLESNSIKENDFIY